MVSLRTLCSSRQHLYKLLKHQYSSQFVRNPLLRSSSRCLCIFSNAQELGPYVKSLVPISLFKRNFSGCAELVSEDVTEEQVEVKMADCNEGLEKLEKKGENGSTVGGNGVVSETEEMEENGIVEELEKGGSGIADKKNGSAKVRKKKGRDSIASKLKEIKKLEKKGENSSTVGGNGVVRENEEMEENGLVEELEKGGSGIVDEKNGSAKVRKKKGRDSIASKLKEIKKLEKKGENSSTVGGNGVVRENEEMEENGLVEELEKGGSGIADEKNGSAKVRKKKGRDSIASKLNETKKLEKKGENSSTVGGNGVVRETEEMEENGLVEELEKGGSGIVDEKNGSAKVRKKKGRDSIASKLKEIKKLEKRLEKLEMEVRSSKGNIENCEESKKKNGEQPKVQSKSTSLHAVFTGKPPNEGSQKLEDKMKKRENGENNLVVGGDDIVGETEKMEENALLEKLKKGGNGTAEFSEKHGSKKVHNKKASVSIHAKLKGIKILKKKLEKLEMEVSSKGKVENSENNKKNTEEQPKLQSKPTSLHAIFTGKPEGLGENTAKPKDISDKKKKSAVSKEKQVSSIVKSKPLKIELSPEMLALVGRWHKEGYLKIPITLLEEDFDLSSYAKQYDPSLLRFAAEKFGNDHQEIAKSLSGSDLKVVALFGCPSVERRSVFAAKRLRFFFNIQEDIVCRGCKLNSSCKFTYEKVWGAKDKVDLVDAMRVLTTYSMYSIPELAIPQEMKDSVNKLVKEAANLSQ